MKPHIRVLILLLATLVITIVVAPFLKLVCDYGVRHYRFAQRQLRYQEPNKRRKPTAAEAGARPGTYDFGKAVRRVLMIVVIVLFVWQRKKLHVRALTVSAFREPRKGGRRFLAGFALGMASLTLYVVVQWMAGAREVQLNVSQGPLVVGGKVGKYLFSSVSVGVVEEVLFRAFLIQAFMEGLTIQGAIGLSSFIYSILHFFRGGYHVMPDGVFDSLVGAKVLAVFVHGIFSSEIVKDIPEVIGLFLTGTVLAVAFVRTGSLYLSMGLHAGWVFVLKLSKLFLRREVLVSQWFFGQSGSAGGILSWIMLIVLWIFITRVFRDEKEGLLGQRLEDDEGGSLPEDENRL